MKISGCVIAKNEEANIANCINNLKNVTDEIIVIDTGSEDKTIQIAKELGAFVYVHKWENDFSKAKNAALDHTTGDWIIFLDADEYFREDSIPKIRQAIQAVHSDKNTDGIQCELINIDVESNKTISNNETLRIFRHNKHSRYINRIHEEIRKNGDLLKCVSMRNEIAIIHTGYSASFLQKKAERNLKLILNNKEDEKSSYYLAMTYHTLKDYENSYKYAELALTEPAVSSADFLAYKMHLLRISITMDFDFSNKEKIKRLISEANLKYGRHPEIIRIEAAYLYREKYYSKALAKYLYALECHEKYGSMFGQNDFAAGILDVYHMIAELFYLLNREADSLNYYIKSLKIDRYHLLTFGKLMKLCGTIPENETIAFINSIYNKKSEEDIQFVVSQTASCGRPGIVLYYANQWNNVYGHEDDVLIFAFIAQGKFPEALEIATLYLKLDHKLYAPLTASVIIMGRLLAEAEKIQDEIGADYYNIILQLAGNEKNKVDVKSYLTLLSIIIRYADQYDVADFLNLGYELDTSTSWEIAEILLAYFHFEKAADRFDSLVVQEDRMEKKALAAFKSGYCYYKLKLFKESLDRFEKAAGYGYKENDLNEFLCWIADQAPESNLKKRAEETKMLL